MTSGVNSRPSHKRLVIAVIATLALVLPVGWLWWRSLLPGSYSVMDMGYHDFGGGAADGAHLGHGSVPDPTARRQPPTQPVSVADLTGPRAGTPDVSVTLVARKESFRLPTGEAVDGYTLNHVSPAPAIHARVGQLLQVRLVNESVPDGVTLHWHGVDVPAAEDGVAGVTQDAVAPGHEFVYRFVLPAAGTYWYHSHQVSHQQVRQGLFGALVVDAADASAPAADDTLAVAHSFGGVRTINGRTGPTRLDRPAGSTVRVRLVNTDDGVLRLWTDGGPYRLLATDGHDVNGPTPVDRAATELGAGGRADLEVTVPGDGSALRINVGGGPTYLVVGPASAPAPAQTTVTKELDLLSYGAPAALGFEPEVADRRFDYRIGRRVGFLGGRPGMWWTINGHLFPDVPMFVVERGDVVQMTIANYSGQVHPMHLHGHHAVVLSRDGVRATGSPWWVDTLNVKNEETYVIAFVADNPGIWMDHCHNLPHATQGLVAHLAYAGVTEPFLVGGQTSNQPE